MQYNRVLDKIGLTICAVLLSVPHAFALSTSPVLKPFQPVLANMKDSGGKCGFIDLTGKFVIPAQFDDAHPFDKQGLAWVRRGKKSQFIDTNGRVVFNLPDNTSSYGFEYDNLAQFYDYEWENQRTGFVNRKGDIVVPKIWKSTNSFEGSELIAVQDDTDKWGFINLSGKVVIAPRFDSTEGFKNGSYAVTLDGIEYNMDATGNLTEKGNADDIPFLVEGAEAWGDFNAKGFQSARIEKDDNIFIGLVNPAGQLQIKPIFDDLRLDDDEELIPVIYKGKVGYADYSGKIVFQSQSDSLYAFNGATYAAGSIGNKIGLIDRKGNWLVKPKFALINQCQAYPVFAPKNIAN